MPRSVRVAKEFIEKANAAIRRNDYPCQKDLAEELEFSLTTVNNFLNGKPVDCLYFQ